VAAFIDFLSVRGRGRGVDAVPGWRERARRGATPTRALPEQGNDARRLVPARPAGDGGNRGYLVAGSRAGGAGSGAGPCGDAVVDVPGPGFDAGAPQVGLQTLPAPPARGWFRLRSPAGSWSAAGPVAASWAW
jgi:hypothetical protein